MGSEPLHRGHCQKFLRVDESFRRRSAHLLPVGDAPASLGPGLRTASGARFFNRMTTLQFAGIEDRTTQIDAWFLAVRELPRRDRLPHVMGRWHRIRFVPLLPERSENHVSRARGGLAAGGFFRRKLRDIGCLRPEQLDSPQTDEAAGSDQFRASQSGTNGLQNLPLCATFWGSFLTPKTRLTRDIIRQHSAGTTRLTSTRIRDEDDKQNLAQSRIPLSSPLPRRVEDDHRRVVSPSGPRESPPMMHHVSSHRMIVAGVMLGVFALTGIRPPAALAQVKAEETTRRLKPAAGLEATLWAAEPLLVNPTNIDVDSRGRVWVAEGLNYRLTRGGNSRFHRIEEADTIKILEDTDGDGKADKATVFADRVFPVPMGIAVEEHYDKAGKYLGCRVFVGNSPDLLVLEDTNGDDKADKRYPLLTGFGGIDSDHGVHGMVLGLDGKLYFSHGDGCCSVQQDHSERSAVELQRRRQERPACVETTNWLPPHCVSTATARSSRIICVTANRIITKRA